MKFQTKLLPKYLSAFGKKMTNAFTNKERVAILAVLFIFLISTLWFAWNFYQTKTLLIPAQGGTFSEGIVGKPEYLNPVLSPGNETDAALVKLIYSGLMKYDRENQLVNDLAESWEVSEDKTEYTIYLRQNVIFHDDQPLTAEDVLFTINMIKNSRFKSPIRTSWTGVEVKTEGDYKIIFSLKQPFVPFLHNLTFGILPKHIWQDVTAEDFPLSEYNKAPIGSGPYQFGRLEKDNGKTIDQIILKANPDYYAGRPFIETVLVKFFANEEEALEELNQGNVLAINDLSHGNLEKLNQEKINLNEVELPRYFAVFLNVYNNEYIAEDYVREALSWATCREEIVEQILKGKGRIVESPILTIPVDDIEGFEKRGCSVDKAREILEKEGWELTDYEPEGESDSDSDSDEGEAVAEESEEEAGSGNNEEGGENGEESGETVAKTETTGEVKQIYFSDDEPLTLTLTTADYPDLIKTAELLKQQWETAGVLVNLEVLSIGDLTNSKIEPREYDALLFGETLGVDPDPRPYWHSSEKKSPGQNIVSYDNAEADALLDKGREEVNENVRLEIYKQFMAIINKDIPAIFLYSPYYLYPVNQKVLGVNLTSLGNSSDRFSQVPNWYLTQERARVVDYEKQNNAEAEAGADEEIETDDKTEGDEGEATETTE
jgi:peptide/nickel transport system substrate-binding protein